MSDANERFSTIQSDRRVDVACPQAGPGVTVSVFVDELGTYLCRVRDAYGDEKTLVIGRES